MNEYFYCKSWVKLLKKPTDLWDREKARAVYERKQQLTILVGTNENPRTVITAVNDFYDVSFYDDAHRGYLSYQFEEIEPGTLFLFVAIHRDYLGHSDEVETATIYNFEPSGKLTIQTERFLPRHEVRESESEIDISGNFESTPEFDDFESLIRIERD